MRELNVNERKEVNGGVAPVVWLGGFVVRYAIKKVLNHTLTKTAVGSAGAAYAGARGYDMGNS